MEARDLLEAARGHALSNDVERPDDAGQKIVEVVGDAAGQLADRLHFLGLAQRFLCCRQLGFRLSLGCDVPARTIDIAFLGNADPRDPSIAAVLAAVAIGKAQRRLADLRQLEAGARVLAVVRVQQVENRHAEDFCLGPSEHAFPGRVGGFEISAGIQGPKQVGTQAPGPAARLCALDHLALEIGILFAQTADLLADIEGL